MNWIDAILLPIVMVAWLFLSYDIISKFCDKSGLVMQHGIGMVLWIVVGFSGGAYIMFLFNAL